MLAQICQYALATGWLFCGQPGEHADVIGWRDQAASEWLKENQPLTGEPFIVIESDPGFPLKNSKPILDSTRTFTSAETAMDWCFGYQNALKDNKLSPKKIILQIADGNRVNCERDRATVIYSLTKD